MANGILYEEALDHNTTSRGPKRARTLIETLLTREVFADDGQGLGPVSELDFSRVKIWANDEFKVAGYYATLRACYPAGTFWIATNGRLDDPKGVMAARQRFEDTLRGLEGFIFDAEHSDPELFIATAYVNAARKITAHWSLDDVETAPGGLMKILAEMVENGTIQGAYRPISGKVYTITVTDDPKSLGTEFYARHSRSLKSVGKRLPHTVEVFNALAPERAIEYSASAEALRKAAEVDRRFHTERYIPSRHIG